MRNHGRHLAYLGKRRALAELLFETDATGEVVEDAGELSLPFYGELANGQVQRERGAILAPPCDFAAGSDDLFRADHHLGGRAIGVFG